VHYLAGGASAARRKEGLLQAAVLTHPRRVETRDIPVPAPGVGEALVDVHAVGICGTDRKIFSGAIPVAYPRIMGHEVAGTVVAVPDGSPVPEGTRVLIDPGITCGACRQCRAGRGNICTRGWLLGRDRDGGLCGTVAVPVGNLHPLPDAVETGLAPLVQVLATCVHGHELAPVTPGDAVVILGLGVTGLLHLQLAKLRRASPIVCVTRSERKLEAGASLGADVSVRSDDPEARERVLEATGGGADLVIECAGYRRTLAQAVEFARVGGRIMAYGTIADADGPFPFYDLYFKELQIASPRSAHAADFPAAIDAVARGDISLEPLVSHRFPLSRVDEAVAAAGAAGARQIIVEP
jgi:L-iditol 2-dehydrogenase